MKVILKVPVYVSVETEKNLDRAFVTKAIREKLLPHLNEYLDENPGFNLFVRGSFKKALDSEVKIEVFSESELLRRAAK